MSKTSLLVALSLILFSIWFFLFLLRYVKEAGGVQLAIAVASYILVISIMMWSASLAGSSILIVASLLFVISDAILAYDRSEEHTSELQSRFDLLCRLLLDKK